MSRSQPTAAVLSLTAIFILAVHGTVAVAQSCPTNGKSYAHMHSVMPRSNVSCNVVCFGPMYCRPWGWHPATAAALQTRAMAAMVEAQGVYNYLSSEATVRLAEADGMAIENHKARVETYFELRELNKSHRSAKPRSDRAKRSEETTARPLPSSKRPPLVFDAQTGKIAWPAILRDEAYRSHRDAVETILARRSASTHGSASTHAAKETREELLRTAGVLLEKLESHIAEVTPAEYVAAKQFLKTLTLEAKGWKG